MLIEDLLKIGSYILHIVPCLLVLPTSLRDYFFCNCHSGLLQTMYSGASKMSESWVFSVIPPGLVKAESVWQKFRWTNINSGCLIKGYVLKEVVLFQETWNRNIETEGEFCWKACIEFLFVSSLRIGLWIKIWAEKLETWVQEISCLLLLHFGRFLLLLKWAYVDNLLRVFYCLKEMSLRNHATNNFSNISSCLRNCSSVMGPSNELYGQLITSSLPEKQRTLVAVKVE